MCQKMNYLVNVNEDNLSKKKKGYPYNFENVSSLISFKKISADIKKQNK